MMPLMLFKDLSIEEYGIAFGIVALVLGMLSKQMQFSNKLALDHSKRREEDLDKISAALIIIQEGQTQQTKMFEKITESNNKISESQILIAKDLETVKDIVMQKGNN